jgi:hypothetical protein
MATVCEAQEVARCKSIGHTVDGRAFVGASTTHSTVQAIGTVNMLVISLESSEISVNIVDTETVYFMVTCNFIVYFLLENTQKRIQVLKIRGPANGSE